MKQSKVDYKTWLPIKKYTAMLSMLIFFMVVLVGSDEMIFHISLSLVIALAVFYGLFVIAHFLLKKDNFKVQHSLSDALISCVPQDISGNALDIGTGNGIAAIKLAKHNENLKVFGIDIWSNKWDYSQKQCILNANIEGVAGRTAFAEGSGFDLPVQNATMSLIISNYAIHTMNEYDKKIVFQQIIRALQINGYLVVQDFFRKRYYGEIDTLLNYLSEFGLELISRTKTEDIVKVPKLLKVLDIAGNSEIWVLKKTL